MIAMASRILAAIGLMAGALGVAPLSSSAGGQEGSPEDSLVFFLSPRPNQTVFGEVEV